MTATDWTSHAVAPSPVGGHPPRSAPVSTRRPYRRWVAACAAAETVGMTAAAAAAQLAAALPQTLEHRAVAALGVVVLGGLVEGAALGVLQGRVIGSILGDAGPTSRRWAAVTVAVAGLGWAAASAPAALADPHASTGQPPIVAILLGAAALGAGLGALLGLAQAAVLRGRTARPGRWVWVSAVAWAPTMMVIFTGATIPAASWPWEVVVPVGALSGLAAGTVLGLLSGAGLAIIDGRAPYNAVVLHLLASPAHRLADRSLLGLRMTGARTGRPIELPVQYAEDQRGFVVMPGHADRKRWWRNLRTPAPVEVLHGGRWEPCQGRVLWPGDPDYQSAATAYAARWPHAHLAPGQPLISLTSRAGRPMPAASSTAEPRDQHIRRLVLVLVALGAAMAAAVLSGPIGFDALRYRTSPTTLNQLLGSDAVSLFLAVPLALAAAVLLGRRPLVAAPLAAGVAVYALYTYAQVVIGQEYLRLPGNIERFFPLLLGVFLLAEAALVLSWRLLPPELPAPTRRVEATAGWTLILVSVFLTLGLHLPGILSAWSDPAAMPQYSTSPTPFWMVKLMDLGIVVPVAVATGLGLLRSRSWARRVVYPLLTGYAVLAWSVFAMAVVMVAEGDPDSSWALVLGFGGFACALLALVVALYRPLGRAAG